MKRARSWEQIRHLIDSSELAPEVKETGIKIFARLAEVEGKIHGVPVEKVHFHEVGATDSIVDIIAASIGYHELKIGALHFSKVPLGRGVTHSGHGPLPVPGPATLELLKGIPVQWTQLVGETVTPTGAAIISNLGASFGEQSNMVCGKHRLWRWTKGMAGSAESISHGSRNRPSGLARRRNAGHRNQH